MELRHLRRRTKTHMPTVKERPSLFLFYSTFVACGGMCGASSLSAAAQIRRPRPDVLRTGYMTRSTTPKSQTLPNPFFLLQEKTTGRVCLLVLGTAACSISRSICLEKDDNAATVVPALPPPQTQGTVLVGAYTDKTHIGRIRYTDRYVDRQINIDHRILRAHLQSTRR